MIQIPDGPYCENVMVDDDPRPASAVIRLCNFGTGRSDLLPEHMKQLTDRIMNAAWEADGAWIDIVGYASQLQFGPTSGNDNWTLSNARCLATREYLQQYFRLFAARHPVRLNVVMGVGETRSSNDPTRDHNHGFYRAVEVRLFAQGKYTFTQEQKLPHGYTITPATGFEFEAIEIASVEGSFPRAVTVGSACLFFGIHDPRNARRRYFSFVALQGAIAIPKTPAISFSAEHNSTPVGFITEVPFLDLEDFVGPGQFTGDSGITVGSFSLGGALTLTWQPKAYRDRGVRKPVSVNFSFNRGLGVTAAAFGAGNVALLDTSYKPKVYAR